MHPRFFITLITFLTLLPPSFPLSIYFSNSLYIVRDSYYTTLGARPYTSSLGNVTLIRKDDVSKDCTLKLGASLVGSIAVFENDLFLQDAFSECVTDYRANGVALAKMVQAQGGIGVVAWSSDELDYGRIIGFESSITIPFVTVQKSTVKEIFGDIGSISFIEFQAISPSDADYLGQLKSGYRAWVVANCILYGVLLAFMGYLIYVELNLLYTKKRKGFSFALAVKIVPFVTCLLLVLWHCVDPFGFKQWNNWSSAFFFYFGLGLEITVFTMILRIWVRAMVRANISAKILNNTQVISRILYALAITFSIVSFVAGVMWYNEGVTYIYYIFGLVLILLCELGYVIYGKGIVTILCQSGREGDKGTLSLKIVSFIAVYTVIGLLTIIIDGANAFGNIFGGLADATVTWFGLLMTFLILFFKYAKNESGKSSDSTPMPKGTPGNTPPNSAAISSFSVSTNHRNSV